VHGNILAATVLAVVVVVVVSAAAAAIKVYGKIILDVTNANGI
jgi:hypothetical protein